MTVQDYIIVKPTDDGAVMVQSYFTCFSKEPVDGRVSCYIPSFDIYFSVKGDTSMEARKKKSRIIGKMFIDHFFMHTKDMKAFALEMHKRGFRTPKDAYVVSQFIKNHIPGNTKFKFDSSEQFEGERMTEQIEVAA
jgi:hypothetical protein